LNQFGCDKITEKQLARWVKLTGKPPHPLIRRGVYYAHRDLDLILDAYEKGEKFFLYTGRGPSSGCMHVGHMVPFLINKYLQEVFDVPIVIEITDDEKFFWKNMTLEEAHHLGRENAKDVVAFGFDISKTFIFLDTDYIQYMYPNICRVLQCSNYKQVSNIFGFGDGEGVNCGKIYYTAVQTVPSFSSTFPIPLRGRKMRCLIPCAIDQDPYFRLQRDVAPRLKEYKTSTIYAKFIPGLSGPGKASASVPSETIFLNDSPKCIRKKMMGAFSGGKESVEDHRKYGANCDIDVAFQYLRFFLDDDKEVEKIREEYSSGRMLSSAVKKRCCDVLIPIILEIQRNRAQVTDEVLDAFMSVRPLSF